MFYRIDWGKTKASQWSAIVDYDSRVVLWVIFQSLLTID